MLADQVGEWPQHPAQGDGGQGGGRTRLWGALRATFLFALWCTHMAAEGDGIRGSQGVVERTVQELRRVMWAQFRVSAMQDETVNALPTHLLTADLKPPSLQAVTEVWAHRGVLCLVQEQAGGGGVQLHMRLSLQHPVPFHGSGEGSTDGGHNMGE